MPISDETALLLGQELNRAARLEELLTWCNNFITASRNWRRQSFEFKWHVYQRNADGIYDPVLASKKKPWQSRAFMPLTASHRETIHSNLYKSLMGTKPLLEVEARSNPQNDQSENIEDIIQREFDKSRLEIHYNGVLEDKTTYGSGFARVRWEETSQDRKVRVPQFEPLNVFDPASIMRHVTGKAQIQGYTEEIQEVTTYRGVKFSHVSTWDFFPDPKALHIRGNACAVRYPISFGDVVKGAQPKPDGTPGYFFPEAVDKLRDVKDGEQSEDDVKQVMSDRRIYETPITRTQYDNQLKCYELYHRLPKKWVYLKGEQIDDPEKLVPARVIFHRNAVLTVELNDAYDGEPPFIKDDYMPVAGQFYGRGIPEMLQDLQLVVNEDCNQRIDIISRVINDMYAVIETCLVDSKDIVSKPGGVIRFDLKKMIANGLTDVRQAFMRIEMGDIDRSIFINPQEMERMAQERTSANKVTLGTAGQTRDGNDTARGMLLLNQMANEKFAFIGMITEFFFMDDLFKLYWRTIYPNLTDQDILDAIGPERMQTFVLLTPEQIENDYIYKAQGIYTQRTKSTLMQSLDMIRAQYKGAPWLNDMAFFDKDLNLINEQPEDYKYSPEDTQKMVEAQHSLANPFEPPGAPRPPVQASQGSPQLNGQSSGR